ncbi:MAG TPA: peptidyl-prolyl cis-trans isomerase [Pyrinomonadaceae bacterium]
MRHTFFVRALGGFAGALLLTALAGAPAAAQEEGAQRVVDEVIAQVNDQVVTLSMLRREMREATDAWARERNIPKAQAEAEVAKRQSEIIASLINEQLVLQKGKELGLAEEVEKQVNQRIRQIMQEQGFKTIEQLEEAMRAEGLDPAVFRQSMRSEFMKGQVFGEEVDRKVYLGLTDSEVQKYYEANKEKFRKPETVTLSEIFLSTVGRPEADVLARAQRLVTQLRGGADFVALAKTESEREDQTGKRVAAETGGKVGTYPVPEITNESIANAIKNLKAGSVSDPVKTEPGYIILRVDERTPAGQPTFEESKVREAITYDRLPKEREDYLLKLRREAYVELAPGYRDAVLPLLKLEPQKSAAVAADTKKDDKKKSDKKP